MSGIYDQSERTKERGSERKREKGSERKREKGSERKRERRSETLQVFWLRYFKMNPTTHADVSL
jgi:hypothetical protein